MQILTSVSKYLLLALLSCALFLTWYGSTQITLTTPLPPEEIESGASTYSYSYSYSTPGASTSRALASITAADVLQVPSDVFKKIKGTPLAHTSDSIWKTLSKEFKLNHNVQASEVQKEIRRIQADHTRFYAILNAAAPYIYYIHQQTRAKNLPAEIALIPYVESEFNPNDRSTKGATGLWQLMVGTAHELGVQVKAGYDGRRDVVASTRAALAYFKDLGELFKGNWYLAIAAYNCGQGRVANTIKKAKSSNYWQLTKLPTETKYYVPRLMAVAAVIKNPEKYGVKLPEIKNKPYFTEVKSKKIVNLAKVAQSTGVNIKTLNSLNPDYNKGVITKGGAYSLLVPIEQVEKVKLSLPILETSKITKK
ncbi:MAG: transglycosylase SLT domain-containing protein [Gammaproteobacteria bacterium]|nr:transglycosylase SLT domain-containing protein [Gammaproteobacteria bacterium]